MTTDTQHCDRCAALEAERDAWRRQARRWERRWKRLRSLLREADADLADDLTGQAVNGGRHAER